MVSVLVVDDDRTIRHMVDRAFAETDVAVRSAESASAALRAVEEESPDAVLLDIILPDRSGLEMFDDLHRLDARLPVIFMTAEGTSDTAIEAIKLGAFDYLLKPLDLPHLRDVVARAVRMRRLMTVAVNVGETVSPDDKGDQIVGRSPQMQEVFKAIGRVAPQDITVLIRGESGTGKELVARAIYQHSQRHEGPILAVNCAAIPEHLLESELFGHEKGAFTGADRTRVGKFEQCSGGTIFLDEVGDMPLSLQSKMLRLLQDQRFQRVGGNTTIETDVRVITATNRNLEGMVQEGTFREDLLYRLNGYTISLPPLRDRGDDLTLLVEHFLARIGRVLGRTVRGVTAEAMDRLRSHAWPGNVRELEHVLRHALLHSMGAILTAESLSLPGGAPAGGNKSLERFDAPGPERPSVGGGSASPDSEAALSGTINLAGFIEKRLKERSTDLYAETLELVERQLLSKVLTQTEGNQSQASRILGITRGSLRHKIRALGISIGKIIE